MVKKVRFSIKRILSAFKLIHNSEADTFEFAENPFFPRYLMSGSCTNTNCHQNLPSLKSLSDSQILC